MSDILSQGGDHQPGRWPRRLAVTAAAVLLVVVIVRHLPGDQAAQGHRTGAASTARPLPQLSRGATPAVRPGGRHLPAEPALPVEPDGIVGPAVPWDGHLRLPVTGEQPVWYWPGTGRTERIGGLPSSSSGYVFTRVSAGWAIQPGPAPAFGCHSCGGLQLPVYFLADGAQSATEVGTADLVAPAMAAGALWLTSFPVGAAPAAAAGTAFEVSVAGVPLRPPVRLPVGYIVDRATDRGLLLESLIQPGGVAIYKLWPLDGAQVSSTFDEVIAASASEIAWAPRCAPLCQVHVLDLATGRATVLRLPSGSSAASGAFSPDGDYLALQVSVGSGGDGGGLAMQLEAASVASGRLTVVPGTWCSSDALVGYGWPAGTDSLVAELSFTSKVQLASWRPGAARLAVAVLGPRQNPTSLIVG
jgi:hypothetical protein